MLIFGGIAVPCAGSCQGHCHQARHTGSTRRAEDAAWSLSWKWFRHISTTHMPIVSHCPSWSPPADFCSTCGAAPLRVCLRKPMSFQTAFCQQSCDLVVWWWLQSLSASANQVVQVLCCLMLHRVISCHIMLLLAEPHSPTCFSPLTPHLVPWLPGATKAEAAIKAAVPVAAPAILDMAGIMAPRQKVILVLDASQKRNPGSEIQGFKL